MNAKLTTTTVKVELQWRDVIMALQLLVISVRAGEIPTRDAKTLRQAADVIEDMGREQKKRKVAL